MPSAHAAAGRGRLASSPSLPG